MKQFPTLTYSLFSSLILILFLCCNSVDAQNDLNRSFEKRDSTVTIKAHLPAIINIDSSRSQAAIFQRNNKASLETDHRQPEDDIPLPIGATESSIKVFSNNVQLKKGLDYKVDAENRRIVLINSTSSSPENKIRVDYQKPPIIQNLMTKEKSSSGTIGNQF